MTVRATLVDGPFSPEALYRDFLARLGEEAGAVVTFTGLVRGGDVTGLLLEHHPVRTAASLEAIAAAGAARFEVSGIEVVHRCGLIGPGEPIVWVAAAAPHRRAAFEAADYLMDRLKTEAVFWKREEATGGGRWIEPTEADRRAATRWE